MWLKERVCKSEHIIKHKGDFMWSICSCLSHCDPHLSTRQSPALQCEAPPGWRPRGLLHPLLPVPHLPTPEHGQLFINGCCFVVSRFVTSWTVACQAPCPPPSPSFLKLMPVELMMLSNHLILCHPLLLLPVYKYCPLKWIPSFLSRLLSSQVTCS